ncbi:DUF1642 domain-containing protein [Streptococcus uberis]|uniref:DUF1642 domain-containing protein n=1 Tax=Streptococcus uberis TaxID=1349 RepID=UPI00193A4B54|nr:DUF1642 domain-containing protein [Streptococcus uberis]
MKIEEAVKRIEQMGEYERFIDEPISKVSVLNTIRQINQPKPEVPQFVADWIEICDMRFVNLNYIFGENCPEKVKEWASVYGNHKKMLQALLYGYTVQKEKLYTVVIPNPHEKQLSYVLMRKPGGNISINVVHSSNIDLLKTDNDLQLTEQEIRKDFEWAWQFAKEVTE